LGGYVTANWASLIFLNARKQLELLKELHIQSQTETLNIEAHQWEQLNQAVAVKEKIVHKILQLEEELKSQHERNSSNLASLSEDDQALLRGIDQERFSLREKITQVEQQNLVLLEGAKAEAIRQSQQIRQYEKVIQNYLSSRVQVSKISQIVE
jgi:hypothetical protein